MRGDPRVGFAEQLRIDTGGLEDLPLLAALAAPLTSASPTRRTEMVPLVLA